jgi:hypothetical protein
MVSVSYRNIPLNQAYHPWDADCLERHKAVGPGVGSQHEHTEERVARQKGWYRPSVRKTGCADGRTHHAGHSALSTDFACDVTCGIESTNERHAS